MKYKLIWRKGLLGNSFPMINNKLYIRYEVALVYAFLMLLFGILIS